MSPEWILLIISLVGNVMVIFKKVRVVWTPCIILDCRTEGSTENNNEPTEPNIFKRAITKLTPRKKNSSQANELRSNSNPSATSGRNLDSPV